MPSEPNRLDPPDGSHTRRRDFGERPGQYAEGNHVHGRRWLEMDAAHGWVLTNCTPLGGTSRTPQFKIDVVDKHIVLRGTFRATVPAPTILVPQKYRPLLNEQFGANANQGGAGVFVRFTVSSVTGLITFSAPAFSTNDNFSLSNTEWWYR